MIVILTAIFINFFMVKLDNYFEKENDKFIQEFILNEEAQSKEWVHQITLLLEYSNNRIERTIKRELKSRVDLAQNTASFIHEKYKNVLSEVEIKRQIKDALTNMVWQGKKNYIWITDYEGNNLLAANEKFHEINLMDYVDTQGRAIILEEIQMVRKHQQGYIRTFFSDPNDEQMLFVKDLGMYEWFIGSAIHFKDAQNKLKNAMFRLILNIPSDATGFVILFDEEGLIYLSSEAKKHLTQEEILGLKEGYTAQSKDIMTTSHTRLHGEYFEPFGWYIFHGFDHERLDLVIDEQQEVLSSDLEKEVSLVVGFSIIIALIVATISILASRRINKIFLNYREEVQRREERLQEWASTLEQRVNEAVHAQQEKEKMLIQQSKMAAMGDMISMIAHQWRQPLNQMSYVFMNIEGAYEYKELTPEYLDGKIKEGTQLLEYMSHTIDDFRNFFRPDKARELLSIKEVVDETMPLIQKSFEAHNIDATVEHKSDTKRLMYRNELMQVLLNIMKNAKDVLLEKEVSPAKILIQTEENKSCLEITICDNGGGIDETVMEKIFDPYFSTKESSSGTGLGLYMSKTIIEEHFMGRLECYNTHEGACFKVTIPKA